MLTFVHADLRPLGVAAQKLGIAVRSREARGPNELNSALGAIASDPPDGLIVQGSPSFVPHAGRITAFVVGSRLPAMYYWREFVDAGGLMMYGPNLPDLARRAPSYVDKILKGTHPADLPVERPMKFDFVINLKAAHALGLTIPQSILQQATEIIQ